MHKHTRIQVLVGYWIPRAHVHLPFPQCKSSCRDSHNTREMMIGGTASPSTHGLEDISYACVLLLMAKVDVEAHTYLRLHFS